MEDFATRTYGTSGLDNRPLFGETSAKFQDPALSSGL
ncbi:similar to chromosome 7 open reading frame 23 (predicted), isoform CRA_a [Rattus norvegicus]|uniref:Similar to chromosome 7 open reading frame 23 (Predicted), isoform CRA_a n=1 Tax=Rattus norvegicus TaxID=10116 RepID=A6K227_RAT|nr:similar to chromosome 7 open reading frame 23 (predicted), isoform CRA_a [Rattus norvegicus]